VGRSWVAPRLLLVAAIAALLAGASAQANRRHHHPPVFGGLKSATTCIPGPVGEGRTSSYHLSWEAARAGATRAGKIVYEVYQATAPGGEDFSNATYTTPAGVRAFDTPPLASGKVFYFVVRARAGAHNEDSNTVERQGQNLCE
jgi:hypothetical protein